MKTFWDRVIFIDSVQVPLYNSEKDFCFADPEYICSQILRVLYPTDSILYRTGVGYQGDNSYGSWCTLNWMRRERERDKEQGLY